MSRLLKTLREKYEYPVDIEYTVNLGADGGFVVNLLQCRPLQVRISDQELEVPEISADDTYLRLRGASMGRSTRESVGRIVTVDPKAYYDCPYAKKSEAAAVIGEINRAGRNFGDAALLFVPGRIGTSSPELGVPVTFADISEFRLICEISYSEAGYMDNTAEIIGEKIQVYQDISTVLAAKRLEWNVMTMVPLGIICYMKISFPDFLKVLYGSVSGILIMTIALAAFAGAYAMGRGILRIEV